MRIFIVTLALISCLFAYADQDPTPRHDYVPNVIPPSPTAAELGRYGQIPVGMFTGTPQISIPLYTMTSRQLSIPVSLSYSSNGIKVDQVASWVGLGWSLNAGGVITRIIRGQEDEKTTFPVPVNIEENCYETWDFLHHIWNDMLDTEPDLFSFNFAGHSGSFVMYVNEQNEWDIALIPFQDLRVEFDYIQGELDNFTITTSDGIKYLFGGGFIETSKVWNTGSSCTRTYGQSQRTSWYLYEIIHPSGDTIEFAYESKHLQYSTGISETVTELLYPNSCPSIQCEQNYNSTLCRQVLVADTWHLTEIEANDGSKIIFSSSDDRQDLNDYKLDSIIVYDPDQNMYKRFDFSYFFTTHNQYLNVNHNSDTTLKHRMFLEGIQISDNSSTVIQTYGFEYIQPNDLPPRLSYAQDHWGFFNGASNDSFVPDPGDDWHGIFSNIYNNREPNGNYSPKGLLNKIIYPTKGYSLLEYEPNYVMAEETIYDQPQSLLLTVLGIGFHQPGEQEESLVVPFSQWCDLHGELSIDTIDPGCSNAPNDSHFKGNITLKKAGSETFIVDEELISSNLKFDKRVYLIENTDYILTVKSHTKCAKVTGRLTYYDDSLVQNVPKEAGGQRIKKTILEDNVTGQHETIRYYYGPKDDTDNISALLNGKIIPYSTYSTTKPCDVECEYITCDYVTLHSSSVNTLYNSNGNHLFYEYVTKSFGENFEYGGEEYKFQTSFDSYGNPIWGKQTIMGGTKTNGSWEAGNLIEKKTFRKAEGNSLIINKHEINTYQTDERNSKEINGYVIRKSYETYCENLYSINCTPELVNDILYSYCDTNHDHWWVRNGDESTCQAQDYHMVPVYHPCHTHSVGEPVDLFWDMNQYVVNEYQILSKWQYLETSEVRDYDPDGINYLSTTTQHFYDNPSHAQVSRTYTTTSDNKREYSLTLFPDDYANIEGQQGDPVGMMKEKHMISTPIETIQYESDANGGNIKVLRGNIRTYRDFDDHILLNSTYQLETSDPIPKSSFTLSNYQEPGIFPPDQGDPQDFAIGQWDQHYSPNPLVTIDEYDNYSNILQYHKENDINVTILWGYNYAYPVAKIENSNYNQVIGILGKSPLNITYEQLQSKNSEELEGIFQILRDHEEMKESLVYSYTYSPLDGMTSETSPNGIKTKYDYDDFGRLSLIRDNDLNILKHIEYNYATGQNR